MSTLLRKNGDDSVQQTILEGKIVDDTITLGILDDYLKLIGADQNEFVIDGWPRAIAQARWMAKSASSGGVMITGVVHLKAHKEVAKERLIHRGRIDDTEEAIIQRFNDYKKTILPILDYLAKHNIPIFEIDADGTIEEVEVRVGAALGLK